MSGEPDYTPTEAEQNRRQDHEATERRNLAERLRQFAESQRMDFNAPDSAAMLERAADALLADERAKRTDREQIARAVKRVSTAFGGPSMQEFADDPPTRKHYAIADAVLALEPEAREVTDLKAKLLKLASEESWCGECTLADDVEKLLLSAEEYAALIADREEARRKARR